MQNYIYGAGGHGKVVLDAMQLSLIESAGFIDDKAVSQFMGLKVSKISVLESSSDVCLHLAIGNCQTRETVARKLTKTKFFSVSHPTAVISKTAQIGSGTFVAAQAVIAPDVKIGSHCIINHAAVVDHDCTIGDYAHIAPQSSLGGGVTVANGVLIGAGAVILPNVTIAEYAIIGAGAVVTKDVASGATVVGNPAKLAK